MEAEVLKSYKIESPINGSPHCFVEETTKGVSYFCVGTGYMSHSDFAPGSDTVKTLFRQSPQLVRDRKVYDSERGIYWIPSSITLTKGMVIPDTDEAGNLVWAFMPWVKVEEDEKDKYNGKPLRLGVEHAIYVPRDEYLTVYKMLGITDGFDVEDGGGSDVQE